MNDIIRAALTPPQMQVAHCLLKGMGNTEIAKKLEIKKHCVTSRLARLYKLAEITGPHGHRKRILLIRQLMSL